jgi:hypothetical protein
MSFLRHKETHQKILFVRGRDRVRHALAHRADESPVGYSWRVALQQSPLPLHQPAATLQQLQGNFQLECSPLGDLHLNLLSHFLTHPNPQPSGWGIPGSRPPPFVGWSE